MYECFVMSEDVAKVTSASEPHLSIVITSPGDDQIVLPSNTFRVETLRLFFHDITEERILAKFTPEEIKDLTADFLRRHKVPLRYFSGEDAKQIVDLLERNPEIKIVLVNCQAGISRSSAVAAAICMAKNGNDDYFFKSPLYDPNKQVYLTLLGALGYDGPIDMQKFVPERFDGQIF
jgi:predicted protein tyrosine phosphatase